ncbi:MAG: hypothetical protein RR140_02225 [Clostridia bacterium]
MKRITKIILACSVLPIAFLFSACNGGQLEAKAVINTAGNYSKIDKVAYTQYLAEPTVEEDLLSYRLTLSLKSSIGEVKSEINVNAILKLNKTTPSNSQAAMKISMGPSSFESYVKDGFNYSSGKTNGASFKTKTALVGNDIFSANHLDNMMVEVQNILELFEKTSGLTVEKSEANGEVKFKLTSPEYSSGGISINGIVGYLIFKNNNLIGAKISYGKDSANEITMSEFVGEINFPDFSSYVTA